MSTVFTFWQTQEDEREFIQYLDKRECCCCSRGDYSTPENFLIKSIKDIDSLPKDRNVLLFPRSLADGLIFARGNKVNARSYFVDLDSPVICCSRGQYGGPVITPTNVFADWRRVIEVDGRDVFQDKNSDFIKWGKSIFSWLRKRASVEIPEKDLPMTENARLAFETGIDLAKF